MNVVRFPGRRPGRPGLGAGRKRALSIHLHLTETELSQIRSRARFVGVHPSTLARDCALYLEISSPSIQRISPVAIGHLTRVGSLLNGAMRRINAGRLAPEIRSILEDLHAVLLGLLHRLEAETR